MSPGPAHLDPQDLKEALAARARELGFAAFGVAPALPLGEHQERFDSWLDAGHHGPMDYLERHREVRGDPRALLEGARSVLCLLVDYGGEAPPGPEEGLEERPPGGRVARYARARDYHIVLRKRLEKLAATLGELAPGARSRPLVDLFPLLERAFAWRAGLGFLARNTMLITPGVGSYTLLCELVTDVELPPDSPREGTCGSCTRCLDACPTGALPEPGVLDAGRCISCWNIEVRGPLPEEARLHGWAFGCDVCQEVCPYNHLGRHPALGEDFHTPRAAGAYLGAREVLALRDYPSFRDRFAGTPIMRARRDGLERNLHMLLEEGGEPLPEGIESDPEGVSRGAGSHGTGRDPVPERIIRTVRGGRAFVSKGEGADIQFERETGTPRETEEK